MDQNFVVSDFDVAVRRWHVSDSELGRAYPPEYLEGLSTQGLYTALEWMKANELPHQLVNLVESTANLLEISVKAEKGVANDIEYELVTELVPDITRDILQLGGDFMGDNFELKPGLPAGWHGDPEEKADHG